MNNSTIRLKRRIRLNNKTKRSKSLPPRSDSRYVRCTDDKDDTQFIKNLYMNISDATKSIRTLSECLLKTGSVIAGGSVLRYILQKDVSWDDDLDIYIPKSNFNTFMSTLFEDPKYFRIIHEDAYISPAYDESFFRQNNINGRLHLKLFLSERFTFSDMKPFDDEDDSVYQNIDLIIVDDMKTTVLDVVTNFDLTCCEIWYDGNYIYTTSQNNLRDIKNQVAYLKPLYHEAYFRGNRYLANRVRKYTKVKGFTINLRCTMKNNKPIVLMSKRKKKL